MILPECILVGRTLAGLASPLRLRPQEGKVLVTEAHHATLDILFIDLAPRASGKSPAVRSLKVAEFNEGNRGLGITLEMPGLGYNRRHQLSRVGRLVLGTG